MQTPARSLSSLPLLCGLLLACTGGGSSEPAAAESPAAEAESGGEQPASPDDTEPAPAAGAESDTLAREAAVDFCVELHEHGARCAGEFLDTLMGLRAKYNPQFAQMLADPERAKMMREEGLKEVAADGTGPIESRRARCGEYVDHGPPTSPQDAAAMRECFALQACGELVQCLSGPLEHRMARGGYQPPQQNAEEPAAKP